MPPNTEQTQAESTPDSPRNGADFLPHLDGRRRDVKRLRQRYTEYRNQLGHAPSPSDETLLKQAATLSVRMEDLAADLAIGNADDDALIRTGGTLNRTLYRLGLVDLPTAPASNSLAATSHREGWRRERHAAIEKKLHHLETPDAELVQCYMELLRLGDPNYVEPEPCPITEDPILSDVSDTELEALAADYRRASDQLRALYEHPSGEPDA